MFLRYNLPHIFTAANLLCGCLAIALTFNHHFETATWMIIAASLFDFFDGFVARLLRVEGLLGKQLDSLADLGTSFRSTSEILHKLILINSHVRCCSCYVDLQPRQLASKLLRLVDLRVRFNRSFRYPTRLSLPVGCLQLDRHLC